MSSMENGINNGVEPTPLCIKDFFKRRYLIPIYQRGYAWGTSEIRQLIQDVFDYSTRSEKNKYYIGSLIVYKRKDGYYETIDGQQRLTTLALLIAWRRKHTSDGEGTVQNLDLTFESRSGATNTLRALYGKNTALPSNYSPEINNAYESIGELLRTVIKDSEKGAALNIDEKIKEFYEYLQNEVIILQIEVPADTDLNHYFEIMNNRGEQLEQHEILKAHCLEKIDAHQRPAFTKIWDACANMNRYIQESFTSKDNSSSLFSGDDCVLAAKTAEETMEDVLKYVEAQNQNAESPQTMSLKYILESKPEHEKNQQGSDELGEKFDSVIDFPNFLLHVLRLQVAEQPDHVVPLDDKRLLSSFDTFLLHGDAESVKVRVLQFGFNLLKCKFLFDTYIIKKENHTDGKKWQLRRCIKNEDKNSTSLSLRSTFGDDENDGKDKENLHLLNARIAMLLSMFHVSSPPQVYKHWLNGALKYVFGAYNGGQIDPLKYLGYLEGLAQAFLHDRFLAKVAVSYFDIIHQNNGIAHNTASDNDIERERLNKGTHSPHFAFNYLDYLLWRREHGKYDRFIFTVRNSIEHWSPQNQTFTDQKDEANDILDTFGNLCLIGRGQNSRLSNHSPAEKAARYSNKDKHAPIDSIKQQKMIEITSNEKWGKRQIEKHGKEMIDILLSTND